MADYETMYFLLFNKITDTIDDLQKIQKQAEEMYILQEEHKISVSHLQDKDSERSN